MNWLESKMKWIMLVSGLLTLTMVYPALAPQAALRSMFGESIEGPLAEVVVRNWGALIALIGAMLIYGAFNASSRPLVLTVAAVSKVIFIGLVLSQGARFLGQQVALGAAIDCVMVIVFAAYLLGAGRNVSPARR